MRLHVRCSARGVEPFAGGASERETVRGSRTVIINTTWPCLQWFSCVAQHQWGVVVQGGIDIPVGGQLPVVSVPHMSWTPHPPWEPSTGRGQRAGAVPQVIHTFQVPVSFNGANWPNLLSAICGLFLPPCCIAAVPIPGDVLLMGVLQVETGQHREQQRLREPSHLLCVPSPPPPKLGSPHALRSTAKAVCPN